MIMDDIMPYIILESFPKDWWSLNGGMCRKGQFNIILNFWYEIKVNWPRWANDWNEKGLIKVKLSHVKNELIFYNFMSTC